MSTYTDMGTTTATVTVSIEPDRSGNFYCSGAADDVEINAALTYVNALGGGKVVLLRGTYTLADPITFPGNELVLQGMGRASFIDGDGLATTEHGIVMTGRDDCVIKDLSIQTEDGGEKTCHCIFIEDGSDRFIIEGVIFVNSDTNNIHIEGTNIVVGYIIKCQFLDSDADAVLVAMDGANYADNLYIINNEISSAGQDGISISSAAGGRYWIVAENRVTSTTRYGIVVGWTGLDAYGCVVNNEIFSSGDSAIYPIGNHIVIDGNIMYNSGGWASIRSFTAYSVISNNISVSSDEAGIYLNAAVQTVISGNVILSSGEHGIQCSNCDDNVFTNNMIKNSGQDTTNTYDGIYLETSDDNLIVDNIITCPAATKHRYCINLVSGVQTTVKRNRLQDGATGLFNDGGTDTIVHWIWISVPNPDASLGQHQGAQMLNGVDTTVGLEFYFPLEYQELVTIQAVVLQIDDGASGNMVWTVATDYGKVGTGDYDDQQDTAGATSAITQDLLEVLDVSAAFTVGPVAIGDLVGFEFTRDGDDGSDTLAAPCLLLGVRIRYV